MEHSDRKRAPPGGPAPPQPPAATSPATRPRRMASLAGTAESPRNSGVRSKKEKLQQEPWPEEIWLNRITMVRAYLLKVVTGIGYLALTWSTVVLLGGFFTALGKKDFWCLTFISMIQAAGSVMSSYLRINSPSTDHPFSVLSATFFVLFIVYIYSVTIHHPGCRISYSSPEVILKVILHPR